MGDDAQAKARIIAECVSGVLGDAIKDVEFCSKQLPEAQDFHFYSNFAQFKQPIAEINSRAQSILREIGLTKSLRTEVSHWPDDAEQSYNWLVGVQDDILEDVGTALDELGAGRKSRETEFSRAATRNSSTGNSRKDRDIQEIGAKVSSKKRQRPPIPFHVKSLSKPQDKFDYPADNSAAAFRHVSREELLGCSSSQPATAVELHAKSLGFGPGHPLKDELESMAFMDSFPCGEAEPQKPKPLSETPFTMVELPSALQKMAEKLRAVREFAVDLENHHYRSYQGFVCLMQISTRSEDFVVDTLVLREHIGPTLRDVFANPSIRKVLHGSDRDILWLQRDFGIYICNMFDTGQAARVLNMDGFGLAFLLDKFCSVQADKRYQLADWRLRPLTAEMLKYAREDTHYLLYVYDMVQQLLQTHQLTRDSYFEVCRRSRDLCLQLYEKEKTTDTSFLQLHGLAERNFNPKQLAIVAALFAWRDDLSRKEDESTGYVMPNDIIFRLAKDAPGDAKKLHAILKSGHHPIATFHARTILSVIQKANSAPTDAITALIGKTSAEENQDIVREDGEIHTATKSSAVTLEQGLQELHRVKDTQVTGAVVHQPINQPRGEVTVESKPGAKVEIKKKISVASPLGRPASRGLGAALFGKPLASKINEEAIKSIQASLILPFAMRPTDATKEQPDQDAGDKLELHEGGQDTDETAKQHNLESDVQQVEVPTKAADAGASNATRTSQVDAEFEECMWFDDNRSNAEAEAALPPSLNEKYGSKLKPSRSRNRPRRRKNAGDNNREEEAGAVAVAASNVFRDGSRKRAKNFNPTHYHPDESGVEGRKAIKRRAVFPASGNRTATFN